MISDGLCLYPARRLPPLFYLCLCLLSLSISLSRFSLGLVLSMYVLINGEHSFR